MRETVRVKVDDLTFNSFVEAANYLDCKSYHITNALKVGDSVAFRGHTVTRLDPIKPKHFNKSPCKSLRDGTLKLEGYKLGRKGYRTNKGCPVLCTTTNKSYPTITALAKELNMNQWTLSIKLEQAGKFIDKDGNEYIRQKPMQRYSDKPLQSTNETYTPKGSHEKSIVVSTPIEIKTTTTSNGLQALESAGVTLAKESKYEAAAKVFGLLAEIHKESLN